MRALLDVNVIIALLDPDHAFHSRAHVWWKSNTKQGWASCPITENGVVRIMSNPGYSNNIRFTPERLIVALRELIKTSDHLFWPDDISLRDDKQFVPDRMHSSRLLTDLYLLALATKHGGRLVTFDLGIPTPAVTAATAANLCVI